MYLPEIKQSGIPSAYERSYSLANIKRNDFGNAFWENAKLGFKFDTLSGSVMSLTNENKVAGLSFDEAKPLTYDQWKKSSYYREGLKYEDDMNTFNAKLKADDYDQYQYTTYLNSQSDSFGMKAVQFTGRMSAQLADVINFIPFFGVGSKVISMTPTKLIPSLLKTPAVKSALSKSYVRGAIEVGAATSAVQPSLSYSYGRIGEERTYKQIVADITLGAAFGAALGAAAGYLSNKGNKPKVSNKGNKPKVTDESNVAPGINVNEQITNNLSKIDELTNYVLDNPKKIDVNKKFIELNNLREQNRILSESPSISPSIKKKLKYRTLKTQDIENTILKDKKKIKKLEKKILDDPSSPFALENIEGLKSLQKNFDDKWTAYIQNMTKDVIDTSPSNLMNVSSDLQINATKAMSSAINDVINGSSAQVTDSMRKAVSLYGDKLGVENLTIGTPSGKVLDDTLEVTSPKEDFFNIDIEKTFDNDIKELKTKNIIEDTDLKELNILDEQIASVKMNEDIMKQAYNCLIGKV